MGSITGKYIRQCQKNIGIIKQVRAKKLWIIGEMIDKMEKHRKWKSVNTEAGRRKYKQLNNELRRIRRSERDIVGKSM